MENGSVNSAGGTKLKLLTSWDVLAGIVPLLACLPFLIGQAVFMWREPQTMVGLAVWLLVAVIIMLKGRGTISKHKARVGLAFCLLLFGSYLLISGILYWSVDRVTFAACSFLTGWGVVRFDKCRWHEAVTWGLLLLVSVPFPLIHKDLDSWISHSAAEWCSTVLDAHGVTHFLENGTLTLRSGSFTVGNATSAKLGLYAILCCVAAWAWLRSRSLSQSILLMLASLLGLWLTRFIAILLVCWGSLRFDSDWTAANWPHYSISFGAFGAVALLVLMMDKVIVAVLSTVPSMNPEHFTLFATINTMMTWPIKGKTEESDGDFDNPELIQFKQMMRDWENSWYSFDWSKSLAVRGVYLLVAIATGISLAPTLLATARSGIVHQVRPTPELALEDFQKLLVQTVLPTEIGQFRQAGFQFGPKPEESKQIPQTGLLAARWIYAWRGNSVSVSLTAPSAEWNSPLTAESSINRKSSAVMREAIWPWFDCRSTNALGGDSYLLQCCFSDSLRPIEDTAEPSMKTWPLFEKLSPHESNEVWLYDLRVACEPGFALPLDQKLELEQFFDTVRKDLSQKLRPNMIREAIVRPSK